MKTFRMQYDAIQALKRWAESAQPGDVLTEERLSILRPAMATLVVLHGKVMHADYAFFCNRPQSARHYITGAMAALNEQHPLKD